MSIVIVTFRGAPQVNQEAIKQEEELDARIEAKIKGTAYYPGPYHYTDAAHMHFIHGH